MRFQDLSPKEQFCLLFLKGRPSSTWEVCRSARERGLNKARCSFEWADAPFRKLRALGLIARTGDRKSHRSVHAITPAGKAVLNIIDGDEAEGRE